MRKFKLFIFLFFAHIVGQSQETTHFSHLDKTFQHNSKLVFDSFGYAWITDKDGIYKYDGNNYYFTPYTKIFNKEDSSANYLNFKKDTQGNFWLATLDGELTHMTPNGTYQSFKNALGKNSNSVQISTIQPEEQYTWFGSFNGTIYKYDYKTAQIDSVSTIPLHDNHPQEIRSIAFTNNQTMWVSTSEGIIYKYTNTDNHNAWQRLQGPYFSSIGGIINIVSDNKNRLWISSEFKGIFSYEVQKMQFKKYLPTAEHISKDNMLFLTLYYDKNDKIWAGTDGNGLFSIDLKTDLIKNFKHNNANKFSLSNNTVVEINEDSNNNIWVSTKNGYINIIPNSTNNINYFSGSANGVPTSILSILKTSDNIIWLGTDGFGLTKVLPDGTTSLYSNEKSSPNYFKGKYIQGLVEDSNHSIWIATYQNGLFVHNPIANRFTKIEIKDSHGNNLKDIRHLHLDSKNRIWASSGIGLHVFTTNQKLLATFENGKNNLSGAISQSMAETSDGILFIGVNNGGLFKLIENKENFQDSYFESKTYFNKQTSDYKKKNITDMTVDEHDNLWLLCSGQSYLTYYNTKTSMYDSYENKKELKDISLRSLLLTKEKKLWLSSVTGLHEYDLTTEKINSFNVNDGLQGNSFKRRSAFKSASGELFFGGINGANSFIPENMSKRTSNPKLVLNTFEILHKPAIQLIPEQLPEGIENAKAINLRAQQSSFSFRFSAIDNLLNSNYYYTYRLKGFENEWIKPNSELTATYTNVPSGDYTFEVKAGTKKGIWDIKTKQLQISIAPPWWKSNIAFLSYLLLSFLIYLVIYRWTRIRNKLKREKWKYSNEKEIHNLKMNFFAKMSHEIQTPLSLILGPIDDMQQNAALSNNSLLMQRLSLIKNNALRLSRISTDLTTVRDKELNQLKILTTRNNIIADLKKISLSFTEQARFKKIDFIQEFPVKELWLWYDQDKIEHVFYNLLANAFKFTPNEGNIHLKVVQKEKKQSVKISVIDSGPGIPKSELKDIFSLYYQSEIGKNLKGSGIGLALTKELIDKHHGKINVSSSPKKGSTFEVILSLGDDVFTCSEKSLISNSIETPLLDSTVTNDNSLELTKLEAGQKENNTLTHSILIVEDNIEMQIFLKDLLKNRYKIYIAKNGKEGLNLTKDFKPDLIISDIAMPVMDGIEMTKNLQKNKLLSYIPIILLTSNNTTKSKLLGLESGAVAYMRKPFIPNELLIRIKSLIANKDSILSKAKTDFLSNSVIDLPLSKDQLFIEELVANLNEQLENTEFKLEKLSDIMHMSYSVIYRKCHEITGKTLVEFFRCLKLKRSALLITEQGYNISEAAFMVGYKDAKYFSKCFKDEFSTTPTAMKNEAKQIGFHKVAAKYGF